MQVFANKNDMWNLLIKNPNKEIMPLHLFYMLEKQQNLNKSENLIYAEFQSSYYRCGQFSTLTSTFELLGTVKYS